ncbi:DUF3400 domain-containing protein [Aromatoleum sp.]|uniref:DUF3400 domain-containing protein n=1 Tax=Aromatoleum sp. TaxID=2307007 RepID=UPI003916F402
MSRYSNDAGGVDADCTVVEIAKHVLRDDWMPGYAQRANGGGHPAGICSRLGPKPAPGRPSPAAHGNLKFDNIRKRIVGRSQRSEIRREPHRQYRRSGLQPSTGGSGCSRRQISGNASAARRRRR